jgi:hypothetical protein
MGKDRSFCCHTWICILRFSFPRRRRLLLQQEDGESQNTFSWTGWMMGWMDGKSFTTTMSFTICNHSKMKLSHWDQSNYLPNQNQELVVKYDLTVFIILVPGLLMGT